MEAMMTLLHPINLVVAAGDIVGHEPQGREDGNHPLHDQDDQDMIQMTVMVVEEAVTSPALVICCGAVTLCIQRAQFHHAITGREGIS